MASELLIGHGNNHFDDPASLSLPQIPKETDSYTPVPHRDLVESIKSEIEETIEGIELVSQQYILSGGGNKMFGTFNFQHTDEELGLAVGFRNSYDKSIAVGIALGASVFVCSNMAFVGEVVCLRRHTKNVWKDLEVMLKAALPEANSNYEQILQDASMFKEVSLNDTEAYEHLGVLFGKGVISSRQLGCAVKKWHHPDHDAFTDRNMWSLYNSVNDALKKTPPTKILEKHIQLHDVLGSRI